jgi:hypothetical protein
MSGLSRETLTKASASYGRWPWWFGQTYRARTSHYRCPFDFSKMEIPKNTNWSTFKNQLEEELLVCPRCGHKLGEWYIKWLKDQQKERQ